MNAEIDGTDILYKNFYNIGVAVSGPKGLVVPVLRDADKLSFSGVELGIGELAWGRTVAALEFGWVMMD